MILRPAGLLAILIVILVTTLTGSAVSAQPLFGPIPSNQRDAHRQTLGFLAMIFGMYLDRGQVFAAGMQAELRSDCREAVRIWKTLDGCRIPLWERLAFRALGECHLSHLDDPGPARTWFWRAAQNGDPDSAERLAEMHEKGIGGAKNLEEARRWRQAVDPFRRAEWETALEIAKSVGVVFLLLLADFWGA